MFETLFAFPPKDSTVQLNKRKKAFIIMRIKRILLFERRFFPEIFFDSKANFSIFLKLLQIS